MALSLKPINLCRKLYITSRCYCDRKSIYQRDEDESKKVRTIHGKPYPQWRKPWIEREGEWSSKFSLFVEKNPNPDILTAMQKVPDLTMKKVKDWWGNMKEIKEVQNQKYLAKRVEILGSNLGALHFFTYRGGSVRLKDSMDWIVGDPDSLKLPDHYEDGYFVEAIDCSGIPKGGIRYEGLENLMDLNFLTWLSLKNNIHVDVWGLDRLAGLNGRTLEYLDISGCNLTVGCVYALARMPALKMLIITDPGDDVELQAGLSMLESERPNLLIHAI